MEDKKCLWCEKELKGRQRRYCSKKCYSERYHNINYTKKKNDKRCVICDRNLAGIQKKYCSK